MKKPQQWGFFYYMNQWLDAIDYKMLIHHTTTIA